MRFDPAGKLVLGLGTGVAFGALLQKGQVGKYDVIVDQLLLRDGRVAKVMGTAVAVGAAGVYALVKSGQLGMKSGLGFYDWSKRDAAKLIENRDRQIVRQLEFLKEIGEL